MPLSPFFCLFAVERESSRSEAIEEGFSTVKQIKEEKLRTRKGLLVSSVWAQEPSLFGKIKIPLAVKMFCSTVTVANFNQFFNNGKEEKKQSTSTGHPQDKGSFR